MKPSNRHALNFLVELSIIFSVLIILLFYLLEMNQIEESAKKALYKASTESKRSTNEILPDVYCLYTEEKDNACLITIEKEIITYYINNQNTIPFGQIQQFFSDKNRIYFLPVDKKRLQEEWNPNAGTLLMYVDVTFVSDLVQTTTWILTVVMLFFASILYGVGKHTTKILDKKDNSMKRFFENASHELKTPLMAIRGYADGIKHGLVDFQKGYEVITKETDRMANLVRTILALNKIDSGVLLPNIMVNDVREILYDAINIIKPVAEEKGILLSLQLPEPLMSKCDEDMIFSTVSNIITNSIRYAKSKIELKAYRENSSIRIYISDDGNSLSKYDREHIFDRFYKGEKGQCGIGMTLAYEYIKLHKGTIKLLSCHTTSFEILLPVTTKSSS